MSALEIEPQRFRVPSHHRTGVAAGHVCEIRAFFRNARQPYALDAFFGKPRDMTVGKFRRQTKALRGDALDAEPCNVVIGIGGELHMKAELRKKRVPIRVVLIDIKDTGDADGAASRLFFFNHFAVKEKV